MPFTEDDRGEPFPHIVLQRKIGRIRKLSDKVKIGGPAAAQVMRLGCVAAAGCKPFLFLSLKPQDAGRRILFSAAGSSGHSRRIKTPRPGS